MSRRVAVRGIILDENKKLFCVRLKAYGEHTEIREFWCLPGGGVDEGEDLKEALKREMLEETNVAATVGNLLYVQQFIDRGNEQLEFFFHVTNTEDYKNIDITATSHAEEEIDEYGFVDPKQTYVLPELLAKEDIQAQIASNSPAKLFSYL